ncbi:MAG TPA: aldo/keto reductase [Caulobacteraceae bacterium]|jgi:aryl-alcohol dehydrogenase-like predicted oxidoreductase|nr:aldo/keto reductase [Caulobacteraceae bacterium]
MHPVLARVSLSVSQFGLDGRAGYVSRAPEVEVREMLALAQKSGVFGLDAGPASPHGEAVIGAVAPRPLGLRLTVKVPRGDRGGDYLETELRASVMRLGVDSVDTVMIQAAGDLFAAWGQTMWARLKAIQETGLFKRIGVSAYASDDPAGLARRFRPDVLQAPASLLDQRLLVDGSLNRVRDLGVEVHLRSIFLNGPLFRPADKVAPQHREAAARLSRARRLIAEGRSDPLQAALGFALTRPEADQVVVAAATLAELSAILAAAVSPPPDLDWDDMALDDPDALEPRWAAA